METSIPISSNLLLTIIGTLLLGVAGILCYEIKQMWKEIKHLNECEKKNYALRHNFDVVTQGIMSHVEEKFKSMEKLVEVKFSALDSKFDIIINALQKKK